MSRRGRWLLIATVAAAGGCAAMTPDPQRPSAAPFTEPDRPTSIRIIVQNRNFAEARLYVLRRGATRSLGIVGGKADAEFEIDWEISDPIQVRIELLAGPSCTTEELMADPGDILELQIDAVFRRTIGCR